MVNGRNIVMMAHDSRIDRRVLDSARALAKKGWSVVVLAGPPPDTEWREDENNYPEIEIIRVDYYKGPRAVDQAPKALRPILQFPWHLIGLYYVQNFSLEALSHPAEVYVAHDLPQLIPALVAAAAYGSHVVYDAHELYPEQEVFEKPGFDRVYSEIEKRLIPFADVSITVNRSLAEMMAIRYKIPVPEVILNSPSLKSGGYTLPIKRTDVIRRELGIEKDKKIILFQGGFAHTRNLQTLIDAFLYVKDPGVVLVMMGPNDTVRQEFEAHAMQQQLLNQSVYIRPAVNQNHLLKYTASADAGVIPYHFSELNNYYCTPNKLFEYIVSGTPILANDLPELNRYVQMQGIGLCASLATPKQTAQAIDRFFESDLDSFRRKARRISHLYTWENQEERLVGYYEGLEHHAPRHAGTSVADVFSELFTVFIDEYPRLRKLLAIDPEPVRKPVEPQVPEKPDQSRVMDLSYFNSITLVKELIRRITSRVGRLFRYLTKRV